MPVRRSTTLGVMVRSILRRSIRIATLLAVGYVTVLVFMLLNERRMVYPGTGIGNEAIWLPPADGRFSWDTVRVRAGDGAFVTLMTVRGAALRPAAGELPRPWIIYFHGNGGLIGGRGSMARYDLLHESGFDVLAVEFRGYGVSREAGDPSEAGVYADALAGLAYLTDSLAVPQARIVAYGWSLGAGAATWLAARTGLGGLVTEGAFTSVPDVGAEAYPWLPVRRLMRNRYENLTRADSIAEPWILFHGRTDRVVPFAHAERLASASPTARLIPLSAGHDDGVMAERVRTLEALRDLRASLPRLD